MAQIQNPSINSTPLPPEDELNLQNFLRVFFSHLWLIILVTFSTTVLATTYAYLWPPTFEGYTTVKVPDTSQTPTSMLKQLVPSAGIGDPIETFMEVCQSENVGNRVIDALNLTSKIEYKGLSRLGILKKFEKTIIVSTVKKSNVISIQADSRDAQLAADLANAWAKAFIAANLDLSHEGAVSKTVFLEGQAVMLKKRLNDPRLLLNQESKADEVIYAQLLQDLQQSRFEETVNDAGIVVVDAATKPEKPISPKKIFSIILGFVIGFALGLQAAFLLDRLRDRVKEEKQLLLVSQLPSFGVLPDYREDYPRGLNPPGPNERFSPKTLITNPIFMNSYYKESFKVLRTNITFAQAEKSLKALAILSSNPEEGKTLANANLAISLSQSGKKVLLVDADLRKSAVRKIFGIENGKETGLPLALTRQQSWSQMIRPSGVENLDLLPNTVTPPNPAELLGSTAMKKLIEEFKDEYDFVVFDAPPVLPVTDSVVLSTLLDGVVALARFDKTRNSEISRALDNLKRVGANVVGTVLNCVPIKNGLYRYGYGYGSGYGSYGEYHQDSKDSRKEKTGKKV